MKRSPSPAKVAAVVSINNPSKMTARGRRLVGDWLRRTAMDFEKLGDRYAVRTFRGRFYYK